MPSGSEGQMRSFIKSNIDEKIYKYNEDNIGNLEIHKEGNKRCLCIECGMDSCGVMVISKTPGKVYFSGVGGVSAAYLAGKKIVFENGSMGIVRYDGKNANDAKVTDLYIEMDEACVDTGDFGVIAADFFENKNTFFANEISTKIAVAVVLEALKDAETDKEITVAFTAQRRFGAKGILTYLGNKEFDKVITIDGISCENGIKCGGGCAVVAADCRGVSDKCFRNEVEQLARTSGIEIQTAVTAENLCIEAVSVTGKGSCGVGLGIPVSHKGKSYESVLKKDFDGAVKLLKSVIEGL